MSNTDYLCFVIEHAGSRSNRVQPRWSCVGELLGLGSTSSRNMCRRFGFDPDEAMGSFPNCEEGREAIEVDQEMTEYMEWCDTEGIP